MDNYIGDPYKCNRKGCKNNFTLFGINDVYLCLNCWHNLRLKYLNPTNEDLAEFIIKPKQTYNSKKEDNMSKIIKYDKVYFYKNNNGKPKFSTKIEDAKLFENDNEISKQIEKIKNHFLNYDNRPIEKIIDNIEIEKIEERNYDIPVYFEGTKTISVKGRSLEHAIEKLEENHDIPDEWDLWQISNDAKYKSK